MEKKFIVIDLFTDSSANQTVHTYVCEDLKTAIKLGNHFIKAFEKTEVKEGLNSIEMDLPLGKWIEEAYEEGSLQKYGSFTLKDKRCMEIWTEKHSEKVWIKPVEVCTDSKVVECRDNYGTFFGVDVNCNGEHKIEG